MLIRTSTYKIHQGISIGNVELSWGAMRDDVRAELGVPKKVEDIVLDFGEDSTANRMSPVSQRRDIYRKLAGNSYYFFLNYDSNDRLMEFEVHEGLQIVVNSVILSIGMLMDKAIEGLKSLSSDLVELSDGVYFFKELRIVIASSKTFGGGGDSLVYFYCTSDISHLLE